MKVAAHQHEDKLLEFAYGELAPHEATAVEAHLQGCERCARTLAELRHVRSTMGQLPVEEAPEAGLDSILAYAEQQAARHREAAPRPWWKRLGWMSIATSLSTVGALVVVGVVAHQASREAPSPAAVALQVQAPPASEGALPATALAEAPGPAGAPPGPTAGGADAVLAPAERERASEEPRVARDDARAARPEDEARGATAKGLSSASMPAIDEVPARDRIAATPKKSAPLQRRRGTEGGEADLGYGLVGSSAPSSAGAREEKLAKADVSADAPAPAPPPAAKSTSDVEVLAEGPAGSTTSLELRRQRGGSGKAPGAPPAQRGEGAQREGGRGSASTGRLEASVEAARVAETRRDLHGVVKHALAALAGGAVGEVRLELMKRLCDAYEKLGAPAAADPYCDGILLEYPSSQAAQEIALRRRNVQRVGPEPVSVPAKAKNSDTAIQR